MARKPKNPGSTIETESVAAAGGQRDSQLVQPAKMDSDANDLALNSELPPAQTGGYEIPPGIETTDDEVPAEAQPGQVSKPKPFKTFSKEFDKPEEVLSHAQDLERRQIELEAELRVLRGTRTQDGPLPEVPAAESDELVSDSDVDQMFANPKTFLTTFADRIEKRIDRRKSSQDDRAQRWAEFYDQYPDLIGNEDIVDMTLTRAGQKWDRLEVPKAMVLLATESRNRIAAIRVAGGSTVTLPSGKATTASAAGVPRPSGPAPSKPKTFVEQLADYRARRKA